MSCFVLIGGKSIDRTNDFSLEEKIFASLNINNPKILFIGFAASILTKSITKFQSLVSNYKCEVKYLETLEEKVVDDYFNWAEVIYFGGGSASNLVKTTKNSCLYSAIINQLNKNKTFVGISAGAMLFCKAGMGDEYAYVDKFKINNYQMVTGLDILNITICPHYNHDGLWCYNEELKKYKCDSYAIEDDTAIVVSNEVRVYKVDNRQSVYKFDYQNDYLMIPLYEVK